jgi:chromate reductase
VHVLGLSGSLRQGSYNTAALRAAIEVAPAGMTIARADIGSLPLYSGDVDGDKTPAAVREFKEKVRAADAVLIASPEYNYSIPGTLKNAIDWASRAPQGTPNAFAGKPIAIMGASPGMLGTARMQYHLRQVFVFLDGHVLNKPEVMIARAHEKFDAAGRLTDEPTRQIIRAQLEALAAWTARLKG